MDITSTWYLVLAAILFSIGAVGLLVRRNPLIMFMCVELMLNAVNLSFVTFGRELNDIGGEISVLFYSDGASVLVKDFRRKKRRGGSLTADGWGHLLM